MMNLFNRFVKEDAGQDLIEYAFLAVFIALAVTAGLSFLATKVNSEMSVIGTSVVCVRRPTRLCSRTLGFLRVWHMARAPSHVTLDSRHAGTGRLPHARHRAKLPH